MELLRLTPLHCPSKQHIYPVSDLKWVIFTNNITRSYLNGPPVPHELQKGHWTYIQADINATAIVTCRNDGENGNFRLIFDLKRVIFTNNMTRD